MTNISELILQLVAAGGGGAIIAFLLFRFLGKTWIENKFAERLEQVRHTQAMELQRLRVQIDSMLSGAIKIQEKEFETLPDAWARLDRAIGLLSQLASPMQEYPDLNRHTNVQLEEFLKGSDIAESQKDEIRNSMDKNETYIKINARYRLRDAHNAIADFHNFIEKSKIFMPQDISSDFSKVSELLWYAHGSKKIGESMGDLEMENKAWIKVKDEIVPLRESISRNIHERLQSHSKKL